ncbi:SMP-30/gluconolactonase/LRE family protein [Streptomyces sp. NEAU-Y11]|uniref:SMP-30/gluconolactonase/LRE family protein n=1 Tax=Streptomyces cucumeris TaxID=2962890 RepID=UPI0020C87AE0|nr:SMP-30/gluconolactonase/LRE family protein [Streptomyces sp. NEAU-Y11]MCP9206730.1 SMP-30/gluconolactonase/LRE family protein [Streptomyces sp. NEAU-Y11]
MTGEEGIHGHPHGPAHGHRRPANGAPAGWRPAARGRHHLAEGARWYEGRLLFVDLLAGDLYRCGAVETELPPRLLGLGMPLGAVAPVAAAPHAPPVWIAAAGTGVALVAPGRRPRWLARPEAGATVPMRMNDGVCDPSGRFWAGSMAADGAPGAGSLYRVDTDGSVHRVLSGLAVPNGPAFTPCGTAMYLADSAHGTVVRHPVDPVTGELGAPETLTVFPPGTGRPDGMAVDDDGLLWVAVWGAGQVRSFAPDGRPVQVVDVPTPQVTSVAFGGGRMFVTTARHRLERPDPLAGAVLSRPCRTTARPAYPFRLHGGVTRTQLS